jgi:hypothetical protein
LWRIFSSRWCQPLFRLANRWSSHHKRNYSKASLLVLNTWKNSLFLGATLFYGEVDNDNDVNKCSSPIDGILKFPSLMWPDSTRDMAVQGPKPQAASRSLRWRKACPLGISATWVWP